MNDTFYIIQKPLFVLEIFIFFVFFPLPQFPESKGQMKLEYLWRPELACIKLENVIFGLTQKTIYIKSLKLPRW